MFFSGIYCITSRVDPRDEGVNVIHTDMAERGLRMTENLCRCTNKIYDIGDRVPFWVRPQMNSIKFNNGGNCHHGLWDHLILMRD